MKLFHRHQHDASEDVELADYDAQSDLALPTHEHPEAALTTPFGGSLVPPTTHPAYDVERDTGI